MRSTTWMRVSYAVTARTSALCVATASVDSQVTSAELVAKHVISLKGICREKITNLKSWAVYFLLCRENASSEQGKIHRFGTSPDFRFEIWTGAARRFFGRPESPTNCLPYFFRVWIYPVVSRRCRCGVRTCPGGPPCRVATRHSRSCGSCQVRAFFRRFGVGCPWSGS